MRLNNFHKSVLYMCDTVLQAKNVIIHKLCTRQPNMQIIYLLCIVNSFVIVYVVEEKVWKFGKMLTVNQKPKRHDVIGL